MSLFDILAVFDFGPAEDIFFGMLVVAPIGAIIAIVFAVRHLTKSLPQQSQDLQQASETMPPAASFRNTPAAAGISLSVVSPFFSVFSHWVVLIPVFGLAGLIASVIGLRKAKQLGGGGRGLSVIGIVVSSLVLLSIMLFLIAFE